MKTLVQAWLLARRELRGGLKGFGIFLACLLPGVVAVGGIGSFAEAVRSGLWADARALLGGDLEIRVLHREPTEEQLDRMSREGRVSRVTEVRAMPFAPHSGQRILAEVKAVDAAYPLYGTVRLSSELSLAEALAPGSENRFGAVAEQGLLDRLLAEVGDVLALGDVELELRAVLQTEPDRSLGGFTLGPRLLVSQEALQASGLSGPQSLSTHRFRLALPEGGSVDDVRRDLQAAFPAAGWRIRTWQEAEPQVRAFLERMTFNLTLVGLCALLAGGVGVHGSIRGYLQGKVLHIATLKCLGATGGMVMGCYLIQVVVLALCGAAGGAVLAAMVPWIGRLFAGPMLPIRLGIYPVPLFTAGLFGLLTAVLFSLHALGATRSIRAAALFRGYVQPVRSPVGRDVWAAMVVLLLLLAGLVLFVSSDRRLAGWFTLGALVAFGLFRVLTPMILYALRWIPRPPVSALRMAFASIQRPGSPAASIVFSLGMGMSTLVIIAQVQTNLNRLVTETLPQDAPAFFVMDIQHDQIDDFLALVKARSIVHRVEHSPVLRGRITAIDGVPVSEAQIDPSVRWAVRGDRFVSYAAAVPSGTRITRGQWWTGQEPEARLSLTADLAEGFGVAPGDTLTVNVLGREITARIANLREVDWSSLNLNFALIFNPSVLVGAPASWLASIHTAPDSESEVFRLLTDGMPNVTVIGTREVLANAARTLNRIGLAFRAVAAVALGAGFLVLAGAVASDQRRRIRDAVICKVCGATRGDLLGAYAAEFLVLGLVGGGLSLLVGSLAARGITVGLMQVEYELNLLAVLGVMLPGVLCVVAIGLGGTWHVLGRSPARYLHEE